MSTSFDIQKKIIELLSDNLEHSVQEMKAEFSNSGMTDYTDGQLSGSINTLVKNGTIKKMSRGVYKMNDGSENKKICFVVSVIGAPDSDERRAADQVYKYIIKPVCEETGFEPVRVDQLNNADNITNTIVDYLTSADLVIADITGQNPNVFYEIGYRMAIGKPIIHLKNIGELIPFDIANFRAFEYNRTDLDSIYEVKGRLKNTIDTMNFGDEDDSAHGENAPSRELSGDIFTLVTMLYEIKDEITSLREAIRNRETDTIKAIVETTAKTQVPDDPQTALMKIILPELIKNPTSLSTLMELSEELNKMK